VQVRTLPGFSNYLENAMIIISKSKQILGLLFWLVLTFSAGAIGAVASANARGFYLELVRPSWAPPGWLFAPVWSVLYLLMGISAWLVWRERGILASRLPLTLYIFQLAANALWTWLFFTFRSGAFAFYEILLLWLLILITIILFRRVRPVAGVLLLPYIAWVSFAAALTYATWVNNPLILT
jgi:translocator protein